MFTVSSAVVAIAALFPSGALSDPGDSLAARWRDHVMPTAEETAWEAVPWIPSLAGGVLAAQEAHKPLLLWVMNGHPLGCT